MTLKRIHMIAICGMGMGSLAGLLRKKGFEVSGSDQNIYPPMSTQLAELGIPIYNPFRASNLDPSPDLVIIGNAVPRDNPEVEEVLRKKIPYLSMPQALFEFFLKDSHPLVVAGTHGKTTTSSLLTWLLHETQGPTGFLVGGILKNFERSYQLGKNKFFVVEGDEYDSAFFDKESKFLHYAPKILVLNPIEFDHADIYRDLDHLLASFRKLLASLSPETIVIHHHKNKNVLSLIKDIPQKKISFGIGQTADWGADKVQLESKTRFQIYHRGEPGNEMTSPLMGIHNIENLLAVLATFYALSLPLQGINEALVKFKGVKRRQEKLGTFQGITLIDDFAHHPTAIYETLKGIRQCYPEARIWAIFEPRSNSTRRNVFQSLFSPAFEMADETVIGPIYHEEKIPTQERLNVQKIVQKIIKTGKNGRAATSIGEIISCLKAEGRPGDIICVMSNGDFGGLNQSLTSELS